MDILLVVGLFSDSLHKPMQFLANASASIL